jgi:hypothetical protein
MAFFSCIYKESNKKLHAAYALGTHPFRMATSLMLRSCSTSKWIRSCPIFPELRVIFDEAFEIFGAESNFVVALPG